MAKIVYTDRQMPKLQDLQQQIPQAKVRTQKPQSGGKCLVQIPGDARGLQTKIDSHIIKSRIFSLPWGNFKRWVSHCSPSGKLPI